ncbi:hypothetical protein HMPREF0004_3831 [Achromobacter piechaudii ATCC 43553]|uniref:Uncharacterized protein n=1 Tax=Achromobacter piechaudii ATCC 43553 TaxID=742159 RepID=D4XED4_9BURK|nr:hypothetical protein HMPREF0004_3831 [Achromobacter piechaudii ATCC 43553]
MKSAGARRRPGAIVFCATGQAALSALAGHPHLACMIPGGTS